jgi:S1-C subfamily serine protease
MMQLPDAIQRIKPSIVQMLRNGPGLPEEGQRLGTGFLVTEDAHVVTAKHVVDAVDVAAGQRLRVAFPSEDVDTPEGIKVRAGFDITDGHVVGADAEHDLALVVVHNGRSFPIPMTVLGRHVHRPWTPIQIAPVSVREGIAIASSGYPLKEPSLVTTAGILASSFSLDGDRYGRYLGDFTGNPGNSGGPVYTVSEARTIGVCVAGRLSPIVGGHGLQTAGLTVVVPVEQVMALLERCDVAAAPTGSRPMTPAAGNRRGRRGKRR